MNELEHLKARKFEPYSLAHQALYKIVVELLKDKPARIFEIGVGIGYGLDLLTTNNCIESYQGVEINTDCLHYVKARYPEHELAQSIQNPKEVDFTLFIETIEHMSKRDALEFLQVARKITKKALFLSTPDKNTDEHGIYTTEEVLDMLNQTNFTAVAIEWQLPHTLFICT